MDNLSVQQEYIRRMIGIRQRRFDAVRNGPRLWSNVISEWSKAEGPDCAWLVYSANYLFRTTGVHWAIDPITLHHRLPEAPLVDPQRELQPLSFVLLTHRHADHLDLDLIRKLKDLPIQWIVPEAIYPAVMAQAELPMEKVIVPKMLEPITIQGVTILPFAGLHWEHWDIPEENQRRGVPAVGYLVEFNGRRWLFPGDTRTYDADLLPAFGSVDGLFAHLWLGRSSALLDPPPLSDAFCRFCLDLQPRRLVLAHLDEFGREAPDYWDAEHAAQVMTRWRELAPEIPISAVRMGECVTLTISQETFRTYDLTMDNSLRVT